MWHDHVYRPIGVTRLPPCCAVVLVGTVKRIYYEMVVKVSNICSKIILPSAINNKSLCFAMLINLRIISLLKLLTVDHIMPLKQIPIARSFGWGGLFSGLWTLAWCKHKKLDLFGPFFAYFGEVFQPPWNPLQAWLKQLVWNTTIISL